VTNRALARTFDELVAGARRRVVIASPYALDRRLVSAVEASPAEEKSLVIAKHNNFWCLQLITPYLVDRAVRAGIELFHFEQFSHAKFALIDDLLLVGSSNFGRHSLSCNDEIGYVIDNPAFVGHFEQVMLGGVVPLATTSSRRQRWSGLVSSALIDSYLMVYARVIAPLVPPLAPSSDTGAASRFRRPRAPRLPL
jgi:phosphatidylserine/phosphatidylglycerophosphate/cardiolipin synthase-like enzyme